MKVWMTPATGKLGTLAVLAIGVWQQAAYHRRTLLEKLTHPRASVPAVSVRRAGGI
jgi:hypothetical protein